MKIEPLEEWVGDDAAISYVAIRATERSQGLREHQTEHQGRLSVRQGRHCPNAVLRILQDAGIGLPDYYQWRTRSGCYFCFYQRKAEWVGLADRHSELWDRAVAIEQKVMKDAGTDGDIAFGKYGVKGRQYTWSGGESLPALIARRDEILQRHQQAVERTAGRRKDRAAWEVFAEAFNEDDDIEQCTVCAL